MTPFASAPKPHVSASQPVTRTSLRPRQPTIKVFGKPAPKSLRKKTVRGNSHGPAALLGDGDVAAGDDGVGTVVGVAVGGAEGAAVVVLATEGAAVLPGGADPAGDP